jgi:methionine aminotransferase
MLAGNNQYAPMPGTIELRSAVARVIQSTFGRPVDPESEITITAGATESTYSAIAALISPGDEVIIFDPAYDSYNPVVRLNGGIPVHINLYPPDFAIPWDIVRARITPRTRMIIINTPHNPSGSVLQKQDLNTLQQIVEANNLLVLSDEVYERLVFDDVVHESVLRYPRLAERSLAVFSFGKTFHATGWKVGYVTAPADLTREIRKSHQFVTFAVNTPVQLALAEYLDNPEHYLTLGKF